MSSSVTDDSSAGRNRTAGGVAGAAGASGSGSSPGSGTAGPSPISSAPPNAAAAAAGGSSEESGRTRRGLDRLSGGLRELGFEVLSRRQRHERDKSNSSNKASNVLTNAGPKSPDLHKTSPPYSRTSTAEGDPRSPDLQPPSSATSSGHSPATPVDSASLVSPTIVRRPAQRANAGTSAQTPMKKPTFVLVTQDHEQLSRVDLNGLPSSAAIRERLYTKAHIPDDDFRHCTVHLSSLEQTDPGTPLDDSELWQICQGVLSGEITPSPLFYVQLSVAGAASDLPYQQAPPPEYPSSPYGPAPGSAHSDSHPDRFGGRPDSTVETSSNSSIGRPRTTQPQPSRRSPHETKPPSPMRRDMQHPSYPNEIPYRQPQERQASYHSPPLDLQQSPHPPFFDSERRSSAGSLNVPLDQNQQQYLWDRRSSAGESDRSNRPEFMGRPANLRRADRQARSEAHAPPIREDWQREAALHPSNASMSRGYTLQGSGQTQTMGIGPSGPLYNPVNQAGRSRSNSASAQEVLSGAGTKSGGNRTAAPMGFGPSGPLHFPQPIHHGPYAQQSSRPQPPTIVEHPHAFQPGAAPGGRGLNVAKSMDNLRAHPGPSTYQGHDRRSGNGALAPGPQRVHHDAATRLYNDPRQPGQTVPYHQNGRYGPSDLGRPVSAQAIHPPLSASSSSNPRSPDMQAHLRSPPLQTSPRIPSYPPYNPQSGQITQAMIPPRLPPRQNMQQSQHSNTAQYSQPHHAHQQQRSSQHPHHAYTQPTVTQRRPSSDLLQRAAPSALQVAPGPQRLPLRPGETLQDALHHRHEPPSQQRPPRTSPQASMSFSPRMPAEPRGDNRHVNPPQQQQRAASWEERPNSYFSPSDASHRPGYHYGQDQRFAEDAPFTSSPPATHSEQQSSLYLQDTSPRNFRKDTASPPSRSNPSPVHRHISGQNSSNRSSSSSVEQQRSPASSRPSSSSGGPFADSSASLAGRPTSHSSMSTNEASTPISDPGQKAQAMPYSKSTNAGHDRLPASPQPHIVDSDHVYDGVEILREQIDAATQDAEQSSRPNTASTPAHYVESQAEQSETTKAHEWASTFVANSGLAEGDSGEDTLGKKDKRKSGASDGESSTLGKTKSIPSATADNAPSTVKSAPAPAFSYNPDEDDDDEAMTWAVQMQPTKSVESAPKPAAPSVETTSPAPESAQKPSMSSSSVRKDVPKHIALPPSSTDFDSSPVPSPRSEKPHLRVKTDVNSQTAKLAAETKQNEPGSSPSLVDNTRSASPRSANRRPRQNSKEGALVVDESRRATALSRSGSSKDASSLSMARRASFNDNAWAYRPSVEQVYDNLEEFFPGHDLDKPIVDAGISGPNSALSSPALDSALASPSVARPADLATTAIHKEPDTPARASRHHDGVEKDGSRRFNHNRKSIRMVAQDRKSRLKKEETAAKALSSIGVKDEAKDKLARRKSTKVWGRKIEEVTSAEADLLYSAKDPASADKDRGELAPVKWLKGELIGKGTYGHVYIGFNVTNGEMFAVKQVELPRTASDKDDNRQTSVVEALKSEMDLLKDLEHEKIVSYLGFEETPQHMSIFLEYVDGGSVGRCLRKHGKFEEQVIQFFTVQILEGLEYLHSRGILHRDLKADNILVRMDGTVKISDFGISKKSNDIYNNNSNMSMQGSIFWMAPEVVHNQKKGYSAKIDIWSLGCVVLEMFAGRRPWDSEEAIQAMFKLGAERLAPPVPQDVVLSNQSSHFLKECFHAEADKRPQASRLLCHKFLTLDKSWDFHMSALYKAMSS